MVDELENLYWVKFNFKFSTYMDYSIEIWRWKSCLDFHRLNPRLGVYGWSDGETEFGFTYPKRDKLKQVRLNKYDFNNSCHVGYRTCLFTLKIKRKIFRRFHTNLWNLNFVSYLVIIILNFSVASTASGS